RRIRRRRRRGERPGRVMWRFRSWGDAVVELIRLLQVHIARAQMKGKRLGWVVADGRVNVGSYAASWHAIEFTVNLSHAPGNVELERGIGGQDGRSLARAVVDVHVAAGLFEGDFARAQVHVQVGAGRHAHFQSRRQADFQVPNVVEAVDVVGTLDDNPRAVARFFDGQGDFRQLGLGRGRVGQPAFLEDGGTDPTRIALAHGDSPGEVGDLDRQ